jgi:hypothetical protein
MVLQDEDALKFSRLKTEGFTSFLNRHFDHFISHDSVALEAVLYLLEFSATPDNLNDLLASSMAFGFAYTRELSIGLFGGRMILSEFI